MRPHLIPVFPIIRGWHISKIRFDTEKAIRHISSAEGRLNEAIREADEYIRLCEEIKSESKEAEVIRDRLIEIRNEIRSTAEKLISLYVTLKHG